MPTAGDSPLQRALRRALAPEGDPARELEALGDVEIATAADASACALAVAALAPLYAADVEANRATGSRLPCTGSCDCSSRSPRAKRLKSSAIMACPTCSPSSTPAFARGTMTISTCCFSSKSRRCIAWRTSSRRVASAARSSVLNEGLLWPVIFATYDANHPYRRALLNRLREPLPRRAAGLAYLDFANTAAREGFTGEHPFNTEDGRARLQRWLSERDPRRSLRAACAASALAFIDRPAPTPCSRSRSTTLIPTFSWKRPGRRDVSAARRR